MCSEKVLYKEPFAIAKKSLNLSKLNGYPADDERFHFISCRSVASLSRILLHRVCTVKILRHCLPNSQKSFGVIAHRLDS